MVKNIILCDLIKRNINMIYLAKYVAEKIHNFHTTMTTTTTTRINHALGLKSSKLREKLL